MVAAQASVGAAATCPATGTIFSAADPTRQGNATRPQLDSASQREYGRVLNDLRTNFVSVTGTSTTGPSRIIH